MPTTIPQTETILKSYFETGDKPLQLEFEELIGTMFYYDALALNAADAAADLATEAISLAPVCLLKYTVLGATINAQRNVASVAKISTGGFDAWRITWTNPFADEHYIVQITWSDSTVNIMGMRILSQQATHIDLRFFNGAGSGSGFIEDPSQIFLTAFQV